MKINKLFPVIVPEFTYEKDLEEIKESLRSERREQFNFPEGVETTCGNLHKNERFHSLVEWFEECLEEYKVTFALQCDRLDISLMWGNIAPAGSGVGHPRHRHNMSLVSGVFYLTNGVATVFHDPVYPRTMDCMEVISDNLKVRGGPIEKIAAEEGKLILFPSWLVHESDRHFFDYDRMTISFNAFPAGNINPGPFGYPMANIEVL